MSENEKNKNSDFFESDLVLGINSDEKITKFNDECEKISGYTKNDLLNRSFFDILIPERYLKQWKNVFNSIRKSKLIDDFRLPLLTKKGHEIMISWSSFPVKNTSGTVKDINLVGKLVTDWYDDEESLVDRAKSSSKYKDIEEGKTIKQLEKINIELERENKDLEKQIKNLKTRLTKISKKEKLSDKSLGLFSGAKERKEELEQRWHELDEREKSLNKRESKLLKDTDKLGDKKDNLRLWREKLETLEFEIEKRRKDVKKMEKLISEGPPPAPIIEDSSIQPEEIEVEDYQDVFDKIPESAVIVQRGILKQVNGSFAKLIGYNVDELIEKSLFDFIVADGFPGLEAYYLNRLKGGRVTSYETVFLTKDNNKVSVEVNTRPSIFNGEKADIAIIKKISKKDKENK
jgi:PAS domain S-box-containing protein